jgi:DNA-directed RNA polymerase subunit RPC12/RpoP
VTALPRAGLEFVNEAATIVLPCRWCGAPLPLDIQTGEVRCLHCHAATRIDGVHLQRAREHLGRLDALRRRGEEALSEEDHYRRAKRPSFGLAAVLGLNVALVGGGFLFVLARERLTQAWGSVWANLLLVPLAVVAFLLVSVGCYAAITWRRRIPLAASTAPLAMVRCAQCGASLPVVADRQLQCPFCQVELLAGPATHQGIEVAAEASVQDFEDRSYQSRRAFAYSQERQRQIGMAVARGWVGLCSGSLVGLLGGGLAANLPILAPAGEGLPMLVGAGLGAALGFGIGLGVSFRIIRARRERDNDPQRDTDPG